MKGLIVGAVAMVAMVLVLDSNTIEGGDKKEEKVTNKVVMQKAMKGGLCGKVASGKASDAEKKELVELFTALAANTPKKGDAASWKEKTSALLEAAKSGDGAALKKAADCKGCHSAHK